MRIILPATAALVAGILTACAQCGTEKVAPEPAASTLVAAPSAPLTEAAPPEFAVKDLTVGKGPEAKEGSKVALVYTGKLATGEPFDAWQDRAKPFELTLGSGLTIAGFDQGIRGMREGGKRRLVIPPHLAYGSRSFGGVVPPNATLEFDVELLKVE